jgi:hypothetical protein
MNKRCPYSWRFQFLEILRAAHAARLLAVVAGCGLCVNASAQTLSWAWQNPSPLGNELLGVAYGNGGFVAVGQNGVMLKSSDGYDWVRINGGSTATLRAVEYAQGLFVTVGDAGAILTSTNGVNWKGQGTVTTNSLNGLAFDVGLWVAVGARGTVLVSTNGAAWTNAPGITTNSLHGVAAGEGPSGRRFVAVGDAGTILTSYAGQTWSRASYPYEHQLRSVACWPRFGGGVFVAAGQRAPTPVIAPNLSVWSDAWGWTVLDGDGDLVPWEFQRIRFLPSQSKFVFCGLGFEDNWTLIFPEIGLGNLGSSFGTAVFQADSQRIFELEGSRFNDVAWNDERCVFVGLEGVILTTDLQLGEKAPFPGHVTDAVTFWGNDIRDLPMLAEKLRAPSSWDEISEYVRGQLLPATRTLLDSYYGDPASPLRQALVEDLNRLLPQLDLWPYVGSISSAAYALIQQSPKGDDLVRLHRLLVEETYPDEIKKSPGSKATLNGVVYGTNRFVAVGDNGVILTSGGGMRWGQQSSSTPNRLRGVAYGNGQYVAVGEVGTVLRSGNGTNWTTILEADPLDEFQVDVRDVCYGKGLFVAVGYMYQSTFSACQNFIITSPEGLNWSFWPLTNLPSYSTLDGDSYGSLSGVTYGNNVFVAAGGGGEWHGGQRAGIITSSDGKHWTETLNWSAVPSDLNDVAWGNNTFVAVGTRGLVVYSSNGSTWTKATIPLAEPGFPPDFKGVGFGNGVFVAAGESIGGRWDCLMVSTNGKSWAVSGAEAAGRRGFSPLGFGHVGSGRGVLAVVGASGSILTSGAASQTYDDWRDQYFDAAERRNPLLSGEAADFDHDGVPNLLEYATGRDPRRSDSREVLSLPWPQNLAGASVSLSFPWAEGVGDAGYGLDKSLDLKSWSAATTESAGEVSCLGFKQTTLKTPVTPTATRSFYRLKAFRK